VTIKINFYFFLQAFSDSKADIAVVSKSYKSLLNSIIKKKKKNTQKNGTNYKY
jgi:hypothetical protein